MSNPLIINDGPLRWLQAPAGPSHRHGTSDRHLRLELSVGQGDVERPLLPRHALEAAGTRDFDELRFYAEHFDTVEVNSTFYGQPRAEVTRGWVERTPPGFEFSREAVSEVHASEDVQGRRAEEGARRGGRAARSARRGHPERHRRVPRRHRSARRTRDGWARCWRSFRRASRTRPRRATTSRSCCGRFTTTRSPSSCAIAAGATPSATRSRC